MVSLLKQYTLQQENKCHCNRTTSRYQKVGRIFVTVFLKSTVSSLPDFLFMQVNIYKILRYCYRIFDRNRRFLNLNLLRTK